MSWVTTYRTNWTYRTEWTYRQVSPFWGTLPLTR